MEPLHLPITPHVIVSGSTFLDAKHGTEFLNQCRGEVCAAVTQEFGGHTKHCNEPLIQDPGHGPS